MRRHDDADGSHISYKGRDEDSFSQDDYDDENMELVDDESDARMANKKLKQLEMQSKQKLNGRHKDRNRRDVDDFLDEEQLAQKEIDDQIVESKITTCTIYE